MRKSGAWVESSLMVGDNPEVDIAGAKASGIDQVYFNPNGEETAIKATYEIAHLDEIVGILS
jgi:putative hydrolase of the HAD superfamily